VAAELQQALRGAPSLGVGMIPQGGQQQAAAAAAAAAAEASTVRPSMRWRCQRFARLQTPCTSSVACCSCCPDQVGMFLQVGAGWCNNPRPTFTCTPAAPDVVLLLCPCWQLLACIAVNAPNGSCPCSFLLLLLLLLLQSLSPARSLHNHPPLAPGVWLCCCLAGRGCSAAHGPPTGPPPPCARCCGHPPAGVCRQANRRQTGKQTSSSGRHTVRLCGVARGDAAADMVHGMRRNPGSSDWANAAAT
jgi:hypothetical protein